MTANAAALPRTPFSEQPPDATVADAARVLARSDAEAVVLSAGAGHRKLLTARDLLSTLDPEGARLTLKQLPAHPLDTIPATSPITTVRRALHAADGRLVGITDADGALLGLIGPDALLDDPEAEQAEQQLQKRESFIRSILGSFPDMIFHKTPEGIYVECNDVFAAFTGLPIAEIVGRSDYAIFDEETADFFRYHDQQMLANGAPRHNEEWVTYPDGQEVLLDMLKTPYRDEEGRIRGIIGIGRDITARKRAEQALQASEDRYRTLVDSLPAGALVHDGRTILRANPAAYRLFQVPDDQGLEGEPLERLIHPDTRERVNQRMEKSLAEGTDAPLVRGRLLRWEGTAFDAEFAGAVLEWEGQTAVQSIVLDVSDRVAAERERDQLMAIIEATPDFIGIADGHGRPLYHNPAAERVLGPISEEMASVASFHPEWARNKLEEEGFPEATVAGYWEGATAIFDKDGQEIPMSQLIIAHRDEASGEIVRYSTVMRDMTHRHRLERELRATNAALEGSNAELEAFAYAVSHDLQEPLRIINSYLGLLQRRYGDALDERAGRYIETTTDAAERMRRMIQDLLEYSRIKRLGEDFQPVALVDAVNEALANLQQASQETDTTIEVGELPTVTGDRSQLVRLFQNLLSNAIKYHRPSTTPHITIQAEEQGSEWCIRVADNGIGLDPAHTDRIFQVFQRLHTRDEHEGTGAGLALAQRIVERHGGRIRAESAGEGQGTTIHFTLPASTRADSGSAP